MKLIADFERFHVGQLDRGTICSCLFCLDRQNSSSYIDREQLLINTNHPGSELDFIFDTIYKLLSEITLIFH